MTASNTAWVSCSQNEFIAAFRKASVAYGCDSAVADEVAKAACLLQQVDDLALRGLVNTLGDEARRIPAVSGAAMTHPSGRAGATTTNFSGISVLLSGASVLDAVVVVGSATDEGIVLRDPDHPELLGAMTLMRCRDTRYCFEYGFSDGHRYRINQQSANDIAQLVATIRQYWAVDTTAAVTLRAWPEYAGDQPVLGDLYFDVSRPRVEPALWQTLNALAARTYVPSTDNSRRAGAGAGLSDND